MPKIGKIQSFKTEPGKSSVINVNAPCSFYIETVSGSKIEGKITPNNPLTVMSQGDIININIYVEEDSIMELKVV